MSWNNGYVSHIEYPAGFFNEQSPVQLSFACILNGVEPVDPDQPFTYCELGCGQGLTSNVLAAANPHGRFYAVDFNPAHVASARQLATEGGLDNLTILENSFAELVDGKVDLPQFDFVTMCGVYGWVNEENCRHVVNFLARYVKPGGIVQINYNTMPGWTSALPLQRLMTEVSRVYTGAAQEQHAHARALISGLQAANARYFSAHACPDLQFRLESILNDRLGYVAHEYMNQGWRPMYHIDVARELARAKLDYVGSADLSRAFPYFFLTPQQEALLDGVPPAMRETVSDTLTNAPFRDDVFVRGARPASLARQKEWMQRIGLALMVPANEVRYKTTVLTGEKIDRPELYLPVIEALAQGPQSLAALASLPAFADETVAAVYEIAALLITGKQARACCVSRIEQAGLNARRMNAAITRHSRYDKAYSSLASPLLGSGMPTGPVMRLVYRALCEEDGSPAAETVPDEVVIARVKQLVHAEAEHPGQADLARFLAEPDGMDELADKVRTVLQNDAPIWHQLGMI